MYLYLKMEKLDLLKLFQDWGKRDKGNEERGG
jgi:hypothetical protein